MSVDLKKQSVMVLDAGFKYSSEDISKSMYRAFEKVCGMEHVYEFNTASGLDFCSKILSTYNVFHDKEAPTHHDIIQLLCDPILRYVIQTQVDLVIAIHGRNINPDIIDCLKIACPNTRVICWCLDDPMQIDISSAYGSHYHYIFTNEKNCVSVHGKDKAFQLNTAFDEEIFVVDKNEITEKYKSDILISGSIYQNRYEFIEKIYDFIKDYNVKIVGKIVNPELEFSRESLKARYIEGIVPVSEMAKYMIGAKICLDIPRPADISEYGRTNTKKLGATYLNPRIFETAGAGSMILTSDERSDIKNAFAEDEYVLYEDVDDCANKMIYYLESEDERLKIANKARDRAWKEHKYTDRVKEIFDCLPEKELNPRLVGLNLSQETTNAAAIEKFQGIWQKNFKDNVEFLGYGSLNEFIGCGTTRKALVVSNAPSLENHIDKLEELYSSDKLKDIDIITVNSAYRELRKRNIVPRFHTQIHPTQDQSKHFDDVDHDKTIFLASALLDNNVIRAWKGKKRLYAPKGVLVSGIEIPPEYSNKLALVECALVVGFTATVLAVRFGYKKIGWLGFDFALCKNQKYAFERCDYDEEMKYGLIIRKDMHGSPVLTNFVMLDAYKFMSGIANGQKDINFFNLTGEGLLFGPRIRQRELEDFVNA